MEQAKPMSCLQVDRATEKKQHQTATVSGVTDLQHAVGENYELLLCITLCRMSRVLIFDYFLHRCHWFSVLTQTVRISLQGVTNGTVIDSDLNKT
jgi:hypothetical protein